MIYILDSCCFIEATRHFCPIKVALSFWEKIRALAAEGKIRSIDVVKDEIMRGGDDLSKWTKDCLDDSFFIKATKDQDVSNKMNEITGMLWSDTFYNEKAKNKFLNSTADIWLVAYAAVYPNDCKIVTLEMSTPASKGRIKIPDMCKLFNAVSLPIEGMFRELNVTY